MEAGVAVLPQIWKSQNTPTRPPILCLCAGLRVVCTASGIPAQPAPLSVYEVPSLFAPPQPLTHIPCTQ